MCLFIKKLYSLSGISSSRKSDYSPRRLHLKTKPLKVPLFYDDNSSLLLHSTYTLPFFIYFYWPIYIYISCIYMIIYSTKAIRSSLCDNRGMSWNKLRNIGTTLLPPNVNNSNRSLLKKKSLPFFFSFLSLLYSSLFLLHYCIFLLFTSSLLKYWSIYF